MHSLSHTTLMPLLLETLTTIGRALRKHRKSHLWKLIFSAAGMQLDAMHNISGCHLATRSSGRRTRRRPLEPIVS